MMSQTTERPQPSPGDSAGLRTVRMLRRLGLLKLGFLAFFLVVALRLVQIQAIEAPRYREIARRQHEATVILPATRGNIFDRNGTLLVSNSLFVSFGADPKMVGHRSPDVASRFAVAFDKPRSWYQSKLNADDRHFVWLERRVDPQYSTRIKAASFEGLIELTEPKRLYHFDHAAGQVIGCTDIDNNGLDGIELELNDHLKGTDGHVIMAKDGLGRKRPSMDYPRLDPLNGNSAVLTLDIEYQSVAEEELRRGVERSQAESGLVVMLDPMTGEVLAMANYPWVNPNDATHASPAQRKNRVITDMFEPGSVFKVVTASAALEQKVLKGGEKFYAEQGRYVVKLPGGKPRTITDTHKYGMLTFQEAIELSSNIVMAKISERIGAEGLYTMARNFGFGIKTGVELPGEIPGDLKKPSEWSGTTLNTMAFGYEVGVTPLQIVAAYAAVANGGVLMKPMIIRQITNDQREVIAETQPQVVRRVISKETAAILTRILEGVVERGTGVSAKVSGVRIAGKTGTSRKFVGDKYEMGSYTASFVGFFPADDPKVVCLVMLENPRVGGYTGGLASAPIFRGIAQRIYAMSGRFQRPSQSVTSEKQPVAIPDVKNLKAEAARAMLEAHGLDVNVRGGGDVVEQQTPVAGSLLARGKTVTLVTNSRSAIPPQGFVLVPDLRGLTIRRALNSLITNQLDAAVSGSGVVVSQSPAAGQQVKTGTRVSMRCEQRMVAAG